MEHLQISCINKRDHDDPFDRIENIGGTINGNQWRMPVDKAIQLIEKNEYQFFVDIRGQFVDVIVVSSGNRKYLRTKADDHKTNNLLSLPECLIQ